jgi:ribosomal protein S18 acetylase RimI-like enzyme
MSEISIQRVMTSELELVEPLWNALREHHASIVPALGPPRSRAESWQRRRGQYAQWLTEPGSFMLLAKRGRDPIGYAMVHLREGSPTWPLSERAGELETLSVHPRERGGGVGTMLLEAVHKELRALDVTELSLHVIPTNQATIRFYERHGFTTFGLWMRTDASKAPGVG